MYHSQLVVLAVVEAVPAIFGVVMFAVLLYIRKAVKNMKTTNCPTCGRPRIERS